MNLAIIPARGGSKRIPRKNAKLFCGKPIIAYAIQNAIQSEIFDEVIVSTDSEEIATIAIQYGAKVPFMRPQHLSDDHTPTLPVIAHALQMQQAQDLDMVCCLYPTTPLLPTHTLTQAYAMLCNNDNVRYVFGALEYAHSPWRSFRLDSISLTTHTHTTTQKETFAPTLLYPQFEKTRSQDLAPLYYDAGQFYFAKALYFMQQIPIFAPHSRALILNPLYAQDIDTLQDWQLAELKYQLVHTTNAK